MKLFFLSENSLIDFDQGEADLALLAAALQGQADGITDVVVVQGIVHVIVGGDFDIIDSHQYVTQVEAAVAIPADPLDAGLMGIAAVRHFHDDRAFDIEPPPILVLQKGHPDTGPNYLAVFDDLGNDLLDGIHRYGKTDARIGAGAGIYHGVHADQFAVGVEQGPAGIAGVDGGIGLDHIADGNAAVAFDISAQGTDDAGGDCMVKTERIADGNHLLPYPQISAAYPPPRLRGNW